MNTPPSVNAGAWVDWDGKNPVNTSSHTLKDENLPGKKTIYVWLKDNIGNISKATATVTRITTEPAITVTINEESGTYSDGIDYFTNNNYVTLNLSTKAHISGVVAYQITNNLPTPPDASTGKWEEWGGENSVKTKPHYILFPNVPGEKKIYIWVKDKVGNISKTIAEVTRVTVGSTVIFAAIHEEAGIYYDGTKYYTKNNYVTLKLSAIAGAGAVIAYQITNDPSSDTNAGIWEYWDGKNSVIIHNHYLANIDAGEKKIYVLVKDNVGNVSKAIATVTINHRTVYLSSSRNTTNA